MWILAELTCGPGSTTRVPLTPGIYSSLLPQSFNVAGSGKLAKRARVKLAPRTFYLV